MKPISVFKVHPSLPAPLEPLLRIAFNLRWAWEHDAIELFRRLDHDLWEESKHNPVAFLGKIDQSVLESNAADDSFMAHVERISRELEAYVSAESTWYRRAYPKTNELLVAYFSAEFGLTECLSIFAGGLGVLAGDHLKGASDLGVPLVGVGLLYQQGYFRQYLNASGWQQEAYEDNDFHNLPIEPLPGLLVHVDFPGRRVAAQVWRVNVGRLKLFLLDTNVPQNSPEDRDITDQLYGGDREMRIKQEIVLGIGGYRALEALGLHPTVYHMNEGHSAFLGLEHVHRLMETRGLSLREARLLAAASLIFTTHTPVAAGHDYFPASMMDRYFSSWPARLGITRSEFLGLGRQNPGNDSEDFCMTVLALRLASCCNGVSKLHGVVSRNMWKGLWAGVPENEIPIGHVTNGVHFRSWISYELNQLYDRYLGPKWREEPADHALWKRVESIPAEELWRTHERRRERLVAFARRCLKTQLLARGAPQADLEAAAEALNPEALTIGFGRRFATYKRATLLMRDPERLSRLLNNPGRPVQIIYAGKAHPHDNAGKDLIRAIIDLAQRPEFRRNIVFLENYDMSVARYMVQGCDIWLNTPLRPREASGTSGMKAQANGALNVSTLDGWWDEVQNGVPIGWSIGHGESYADTSYQDQVEAEALYVLLERDIVPTFYERRSDGLPRRWIDLMKSSVAALCPFVNVHRMVKQYTEEYYLMAHARYMERGEGGSERTKRLAAWLASVERAWPQVRFLNVSTEPTELVVGTRIHSRVEVQLDSLTPDDVEVELLIGRTDAEGELIEPVAIAMSQAGQTGPGSYIFEVSAPCNKSGLHGYAVRVLPYHRDLLTAFVPGLITWAAAESAKSAVLA